MAVKPTSASAKPARAPAKPTRAPAKKKAPAAAETSESIEEQTRLFLSSGNKIEEVKRGVSGQAGAPPSKHIRISNKPAESKPAESKSEESKPVEESKSA